MVEHLSDDELRKLSRGGHDYRKVYAAFKAAVEHTGQPTVILAHTVKGWTLGKDFEGRNATHQMKKLTKADLKEIRDRLYLEIPDSALEDGPPAVLPPRARIRDEIQYMKERRAALGGSLPKRVVRSKPLALPAAEAYGELKKGSGKQAGRHDDGVRPAVQGPHEGQGDRQAGSCRSSRTRRARSAWTRSSRRPRSTARSASCTTPVDRDLLLSYKRGQAGPDPARGHQRGRRRWAR